MEEKRDLSAVRQRLRTEYQALKERAEREDSDGDLSERLNPDRADLAQNYTLQVQQTALQSIDDNRLDQIEQALERFKAGTYGQCIECGRAIALERLQVMPTAELCIRCQEKQEQI